MFTREDHLTPRGDCIVAVSADQACADLPAKMKEKLKSADTRLEITIECAGVSEKVTAYGHPNLTLTHAHDMVIRKSDFTCGRTLAVRADKAACDLNRQLIEKIKEGGEVLINLKLCLPDA